MYLAIYLTYIDLCCSLIFFFIKNRLQINSLDLSGNRNIHCKTLWNVIMQCQVKNLNLHHGDITADELKQFKELLLKHDYKVLSKKYFSYFCHTCNLTVNVLFLVLYFCLFLLFLNMV